MDAGGSIQSMRLHHSELVTQVLYSSAISTTCYLVTPRVMFQVAWFGFVAPRPPLLIHN